VKARWKTRFSFKWKINKKKWFALGSGLIPIHWESKLAKQLNNSNNKTPPF